MRDIDDLYKQLDEEATLRLERLSDFWLVQSKHAKMRYIAILCEVLYHPKYERGTEVTAFFDPTLEPHSWFITDELDKCQDRFEYIDVAPENVSESILISWVNHMERQKN